LITEYFRNIETKLASSEIIVDRSIDYKEFSQELRPYSNFSGFTLVVRYANVRPIAKSTTPMVSMKSRPSSTPIAHATRNAPMNKPHVRIPANTLAIFTLRALAEAKRFVDTS